MKKSPSRKIRSAAKEIHFATSADVDFSALRQQIRNRVGQEALSMVESTMAAVKDGQYAALKYLFEAVGLFPIDTQDESRQQDVLSPTLLHALGLPELPVTEHAVTKDSV